MKKEVRILAISDGTSKRSLIRQNRAIVGVVLRGGHWLEGIMKTIIERNGCNVTSQLVRMIRSSSHFQQTRLIMTDGLAFAGVNIVNIRALHEMTNIPIIAVSRGRKEMEDLSEKMKGLDRHTSRVRALKAAGQPTSLVLEPTRRRIYAYYSGLNSTDLKSIMRGFYVAETPEPIRVARILSSAFNRYLVKRVQKD
jgi:hypothetical protein